MIDHDATLVGLQPGQKVFDRYVLVRQLGRGGMGVVWLARDEKLEREVALKFLPDALAQDPAAVDDLKRETRRALELTHPHIVRIYDFVEGGAKAAVAMEYVEGVRLSDRRLAQPQQVFSAAELLPWLEQLCDSLQYSHTKARIVHRDLKPANLLVDHRGELKVADFGISATLSETVTRVSRHVSSSGTPMYMSPQQMMGEKPAATDDLYSLGSTLYELLTGKPPFYSGNILAQVQQKVPPSVAARREELGVTGLPPIPAAWETTIAACLAKEPAQRPQSAQEVLACLRGDRAEPKRFWAVGNAASGDATVKTAFADHDTKEAEDSVAALAGMIPEGTRKRWIYWSGFAAILVGLAAMGWYLSGYRLEQARLAEEARQEAALRAELAAQEQALGFVTAVPLSASDAELAMVEVKLEQYWMSAPAARVAPVKQAWAERRSAVAAERQRIHREQARGGILVRTTPAGAEVRVGTLAAEPSPLTLKEMKLGKYPVRVRLTGYEDWNGEAEVREDEVAELVVQLVRSVGTLTMTSEPEGLAIEVQEVSPQGPNGAAPAKKFRTPISAAFPTGEYIATFKRPGWPDQVRRLSVTAHNTTALAAEFPSGDVLIKSQPAGATVLRDGEALGVTPLLLTEQAPVSAQWELRLEGYASATIQGQAKAGETITLATVLEQAPASATAQGLRLGQNKILEVLRRHQHRRLLVGYEIEPTVLARVRRNCEIPDNEVVLGVIDLTVLRTCANCVAIGEKGVYLALPVS